MKQHVCLSIALVLNVVNAVSWATPTLPCHLDSDLQKTRAAEIHQLYLEDQATREYPSDDPDSRQRMSEEGPWGAAEQSTHLSN